MMNAILLAGVVLYCILFIWLVLYGVMLEIKPSGTIYRNYLLVRAAAGLSGASFVLINGMWGVFPTLALFVFVIFFYMRRFAINLAIVGFDSRMKVQQQVPWLTYMFHVLVVFMFNSQSIIPFVKYWKWPAKYITTTVPLTDSKYHKKALNMALFMYQCIGSGITTAVLICIFLRYSA